MIVVVPAMPAVWWSMVRWRWSQACAAALFGFVGHVPGEGFFEEPVELGGVDLVGDGGEVPVDVAGGLGERCGGLVGDAAGFPGGQVAGGDAFPEAGEAVAQLEGVAEVAFAGFGRQADGGGELGDGELRDQGCAGSGERDAGVAEGPQPDGRGFVDGFGGVDDGPLHGGLEQVGFGPVGLGLRRARARPAAGPEASGSRVRGPESWSWVYSSSDHRH